MLGLGLQEAFVEPKWSFDGEPYRGGWCRPQTDGARQRAAFGRGEPGRKGFRCVGRGATSSFLFPVAMPGAPSPRS